MSEERCKKKERRKDGKLHKRARGYNLVQLTS